MTDDLIPNLWKFQVYIHADQELTRVPRTTKF
jgi:hypothetical protein